MAGGAEIVHQQFVIDDDRRPDSGAEGDRTHPAFAVPLAQHLFKFGGALIGVGDVEDGDLPLFPQPGEEFCEIGSNVTVEREDSGEAVQ